MVGCGMNNTPMVSVINNKIKSKTLRQFYRGDPQ